MSLQLIITLLEEFSYERNSVEDTRAFIEFICNELRKKVK